MSQRGRLLIVMLITMALGNMPWFNFSAVLKFLYAGISPDIDRYGSDTFGLSDRICAGSGFYRLAGRSCEPEKNPLLRHLTIRGLFSPVHMGCSG